MDVLLLLGWLAALIAVWVTAIGGSIDALGQPREAWTRTGFRRDRWVWQAFAGFFLPAALIYSGLYFVRVRPRVVAAARDLAIERTAVLAGLAPAQLPPWLGQETIKIRMSLPAASALASSNLVACFIGLTAATWGLPGAMPSGFWSIFVPCVLLGAAGNLFHGVTLTPNELVVRGAFGRRIRWCDIVAITQQSTLGSREVRVWTRSGRRRRLRAPVTNFGVGRRRFDADFAVLEQWWLTHAPGIA